MPKRTWPNEEDDIEACVDALMALEHTMSAPWSGPWSSNPLKALLETFDSSSPTTFRRDLLASPDLSVWAIHVFQWNGTCRSVKQMKEALEKYPPANKGAIGNIVRRQLHEVLVQSARIDQELTDDNFRAYLKYQLNRLHYAMDEERLDEKAFKKDFTLDPKTCTGMHRLLRSFHVILPKHMDMSFACIWFAEDVAIPWLLKRSENPTLQMSSEKAWELYAFMKDEIAAAIMTRAHG